MSRLRRLLGVPRRLVRAARSNGVRNVGRFGLELVGRYGAFGALRYALAPPNRRRSLEVAADGGAVLQPDQAAPEGDFDAEWSVAPDTWRRSWAARTSPRADPGERRAVHLVVGSSEAPADAADDDWVVLLQEGDRPSVDMAEEIAAAGAESFVEVVSFDMTLAGPDERVRPVLQPGVNIWLARHADIGLGRYAFRAAVLRRGSGDGYARVRGWLAQRGLNEARDRWAHVHRPLVAASSGLEAVHAARRAAVTRARSELRPAGAGERLSVVICTHNRGRLLRQLVRALGDARVAEVVVVANNTTSAPALETLNWVGARAGCRVLIDDRPFNFARMSNAGAAICSGDRFLFLNDDVTPISDDWIEPLLTPLRDPDVGVAGALLFYPNETVQHAGIVLGSRGHAGHVLRHVRLPEQEYLFYGSAPREVSAVTGAAMMARGDVFRALNGFDELLPTFLQDVDLCLRARAVGCATVWTPLAELIHMESASMKEAGGVAFQDGMRLRERDRFLGRWGELIAQDPLHNPSFDVDDESQRTLRRA